LAALYTALAAQAAANADPLPAPEQWAPQGTTLFVTVSQPGNLLDLALDPRVIAAVEATPQYKQATSQPGFQQFVGVVRFLETRLGTDWKDGLHKLLGGGVSLAANTDGGLLFIVDAEDEQLLTKFHDIALNFAKGQAGKPGHPQQVTSEDYRGTAIWRLGPEEAHAVVGKRVLLANRPEIVKKALDFRAGEAGQSLASSPSYQAAKRAAAPNTTAFAYLNLAAVKQAPGVKKALTPAENPLAALMFAGVQEGLAHSDWLAATLDVEGETLTLSAMAEGAGRDEGGAAERILPPSPDKGAPPQLEVPRRIAAMTFYRDLHAFYAAKDELFPQRTSELIFFENMMGIFFSGRDLTEEVLGGLQPEIRAVVAEQQYDAAIGTPKVQFPAFAVVLRMRDPGRFRAVMEEAWQKAVGLINFTRGQQALPGLIIDRPEHAGTTFTVAGFSPAGVKDRNAVDARFNFRPALAMPGEYIILSSTEGLARDLIDALKKQDAAAARSMAGIHSAIQLNAQQLASILAANQENMVLQNMVNEGHSRAEAEAAINALLTVVRHFDSVKMEVGEKDNRVQAALRIKLRLTESPAQ